MPDWTPLLRQRLSGLQLSPTREREIVDELSQHLDDRWRELVAGGLAEDAATREALSEIGERNLLAERIAPLRQAHAAAPPPPGTPGRFGPGTLWREIRYAARILCRQPGYASAAIATLALAIGATTAIVAVVDALLLRPLPFPDAERLVQVVRPYPGEVGTSVSLVKFLRWQPAGERAFTGMAAYSFLGEGFNLIGTGSPERLIGTHVSAPFFDVLGVRPAMGRTFRPDEDVPNGPKVVILSHGAWTAHFGGDPAIVGRSITLNDQPYVVIGVMPDGFRYPSTAQLWTLFQFDRASHDNAHNFEVIARVRPGLSLEQADAAMRTAADAIRATIPAYMDPVESIGVRSLREQLYGDIRRPVLILLACVGFVLLIACVNVANLQLVQAAGRQHEIALRTALGASPGTIARQLLIEASLLGAVGGLAGVALAYAGVPGLIALSPVDVPYVERVGVNWRVLGIALGLSLAATLAFGLLPAWQSARPQLDDILRAGAQRVIGRPGRWLRRALVAVEVALALVLTIGAGLLVKSLIGLQSTPPGVAVEHVLTMKLALPEGRYGTGEALGRLQDQIEARVAAVPGVHAAAFTHTLPFEFGSDLPFTIEGRYVPGTDKGVAGSSDFRPVGQMYFGALQIPLRRGRVFDARDRHGSPPVVVINETAARRFWPGEDPIGHRITIGQPFVPDLADAAPREIVGVVADVREDGLEHKAPPVVYVPISQLNDAYAALAARLLPFAVVVRGEGDVANLAHSVQQAIWSIDARQPITEVRLMRDLVARSLGPQNFNTILLGSLAALALLLASVGLYGVMAHLATQQTREVGIRMALGATRSRVAALFLRQALAIVAGGVVVGLVGALALTRVLQTLLTDVSAVDPWMFALGSIVMLAVAAVASLRPAWSAASVDPVQALRSE